MLDGGLVLDRYDGNGSDVLLGSLSLALQTRIDCSSCLSVRILSGSRCAHLVSTVVSPHRVLESCLLQNGPRFRQSLTPL